MNLVNSVALSQVASGYFKTTTALQNHQDFGKHIFCTQKVSMHDSIKRQWAKGCTNIRLSYIPFKKNLEGLRQEECREYPTAAPSAGP